jgi:predicted TIM-barrel fold metal-dependent hydrolase
LDIIDAHAHAFPDAIAAHAMHTMCSEGIRCEIRNYHDGTLAGLLAAMDRAGIARAFLCGVATKPTQVEKITDWVASTASARIVPFTSIHPDYAEPEHEIDRAIGLGVRGLKFHPQYMACAVDDPRCLRIARAAARAHLPMAFHGGHHPCFEKHDEGSPRRLRRLHDLVPDLRIIACHMGGMEDWPVVVDYLVGSDVYLETSFAPAWCPRDVLETILARHDPRRILFGTDAPWTDQAQELAEFRRLPLSPEAFEMALSTNAAHLLAATTASCESTAQVFPQAGVVGTAASG